VTSQHHLTFGHFFYKKPLVIARRFVPKRSFCKQETASLKNARSDGFLKAHLQLPHADGFHKPLDFQRHFIQIDGQ
jgi:hypothetical protein